MGFELFFLPALLAIGLGFLIFDSGSSDDDDPVDDTPDTPPNTDVLGEEDSGTAPIQLDDTANNFVGGPEDDVIFGNGGDDVISGGAGNDRVFLNAGDDVVDSSEDADNAGDDLIRGGDGADILFDDLGANTLFGDLGADTLTTTDQNGEGTPDVANGGFGNDFIIADDGDVVTGGGGTDTFTVPILTGTEDPVTITDFTSQERLIVEVLEMPDDESATASLSDDGLNTEIKIADQTIAILAGFTDIDGLDVQFVTPPPESSAGVVIEASDAAQTLAGTDNSDEISTGAGDDTVNAAGGDDAIDATGGGNNTINAGIGDDVVTAGDGDDVINGSLGADNLDGGSGSDIIEGGFGADVITANDAAGTNATDTLSGGDGADRLVGDDGDTMTGGDWRDTFVVDTIEAGDAVVTVTDFNVVEDQLEIGADGTVTYVAANDGADTTVLVDGIAVFLLQGVTPAEMAGATVTNAAG